MFPFTVTVTVSVLIVVGIPLPGMPNCAVHCVVLEQLTLLNPPAPTLNVVFPATVLKPVPVIVSVTNVALVPVFLGMLLGEMPVMVGKTTYLKVVDDGELV